MVTKGGVVRVSPRFFRLIKDVQYECYKNNKKKLSTEEISDRIAKKVTKEDILYNNYFKII